MRLTQILCRWKKAPPGGHMWRGKYRLYKKVTPEAIAKKKQEFQLEEKNMFYLRHPYLNIEQAASQRLPLTVEEERTLRIKEHLSNWRQDRLLGDRFGFLKVSDKWE